jgi:hypothetical protein
MHKFRYHAMSQGQLGDLFGVTSHQIGRWLTEVGLRDDKKPLRLESGKGDSATVGSGPSASIPTTGKSGVLTETEPAIL